MLQRGNYCTRREVSPDESDGRTSLTHSAKPRQERRAPLPSRIVRRQDGFSPTRKSVQPVVAQGVELLAPPSRWMSLLAHQHLKGVKDHLQARARQFQQKGIWMARRHAKLPQDGVGEVFEVVRDDGARARDDCGTTCTSSKSGRSRPGGRLASFTWANGNALLAASKMASPALPRMR